MFILGISCFYHEAAAALVRDGVLVAAAAEERFTRQKHTPEFPIHAINYCLKEAGIKAQDLDYICFYEKPLVKFDRILTTYLASFPRSYRAFLRAIPLWLKDRLWMAKEIQQTLNVEKPIIFSEHHLSHACSSFLVSPFAEAVILTADGVGEWATTTYGYGRSNEIHIERQINFPHSLGLYYSAVTSYLGFKVNDAEWKVMGLAPYGKPTYVDQFRQLIDVKEDGSFRLNMKYFSHHYSTSRVFNHQFEELFGQPQRQPEGDITEFHKDIAHSGQKVLEEVMLTVARTLHDRYQIENLCLAGGVGLNCVANWKILKQTPFKQIFIQPGAGDDGGAIGAAFFVYNLLLKNDRKFVMRHTHFGPAFSNEEIRAYLESRGAQYEELSTRELIHRTARLIYENKVVGWFQGRMEFGPRALGARSILANPMNPEMKAIINRKVKYREWFRPFAPSVLREEVLNYFDMDMDSPFMLLVPDVLPDKRSVLPAVTHYDGTGRVQTVTRGENGIFYDLIKEFQRLSGVPVVLNTSFNVRGEPIVCTPQDAYNCFLRSGIDCLAMGNFLLTEKQAVRPYSMEEIEALEDRRAVRSVAVGSLSE